MKRPINIGELLAAAITVFLCGLSAFVNIKNDIATQNVRIQQLESSYKSISEKLDEIQKTNTTILVNLERKEDRK